MAHDEVLETKENLIAILDEHKISYDKEKLNEVLEHAKKLYKDKKRYNQKTVYEHAIGVAIEVASLNMDDVSVYSAILHEAPKFEDYDYTKIKQKFSKEVADIVKDAHKLCYLNYKNQDKLEAEKLRNMFMGVAKDIRVVIVKLADRLYNMRRINELDENMQKIKAKETLEIYAPIAHRLGISHIKSELEDISFRIEYPLEYQSIKKAIDAKKEERKEYIEKRIEEIKERLNENGVEATIYGRPKHFYSIYKKMKEKNCDVDDLFDLLAIRIIVSSIKDCYTSLGVVHEMYKPMPGRFKDYIAVPKTNMYQSLHTTVFGEGGKPFEIQIRTWDMHKVADYGIAAHFLYKEKNVKMTDTDKKLVWLRQALELEQSPDDPKSLKNLKIELFGEEVFVFTPKGDIKALPKDSTPIDFAYSIHQGVAEKMVGAKINSKIVPIGTKLNNTDVVEVITSSNAKGPNIDWLKMVKTSSARNKITSFLKKQGKESNIQKGRELFEKELKKHKGIKDELLKEEYLQKMLKRTGFNSLEECYENIGFGSVSHVKVIRKLIEEYEKSINVNIEDIAKEKIEKNKNKVVKKDEGVIVEGIKNCLVKYAKCCNPIPGDEIVGYITFGKGVSIHRSDCINLKNLDIKNRKINVRWKDKLDSNYTADIHIKANDRNAILSDILAKLKEIKVDVVEMNSKKKINKEIDLDISINISSADELQKVIKEIKKVDSVFEVKRAK